jgi:hypothetical protein
MRQMTFSDGRHLYTYSLQEGWSGTNEHMVVLLNRYYVQANYQLWASARHTIEHKFTFIPDTFDHFAQFIRASWPTWKLVHIGSAKLDPTVVY